MKKSEVQIGTVYVVKVSGILAPVKIVSESPYGGWNGINQHTKREIRIRGAARLRCEYKPRNLAFEIAQGLNTQTHGE